MGFLDRLLGRRPTEQQQHATGWDRRQDGPPASASGRPQPSEEERAVARYRYLLRTAPPEQLEAMHAEAFAKLTPEQRQELLRELATASPGEAGGSAEPADLARAATRAEMRQPGTLQNTFSRGSFGGGGMGGMFAGSMMGTIAGVVIGSAVANMLLGGYDSSPEAQDAGDTSGDAGDGGTDAGDTGSGDTGSGDAGRPMPAGMPGTRRTPRAPTPAATGAAGGGGDFGGGDFGGGDFGGF